MVDTMSGEDCDVSVLGPEIDQLASVKLERAFKVDRI